MLKQKKNYFIITFAIFAVMLIFCVLCPSLNVMEALMKNSQTSASETDIFWFMSLESSCFDSSRIMLYYLLFFVLGLSFFYQPDMPCIIVKYPSRHKYVTHKMLDCFFFSAMFGLLIELINIIFVIAVFGINMTLESGVLFYICLDFLTLTLFYSRAGKLLYLLRILINEKVAALITFAIYLFEYMLKWQTSLNWIPGDDSIVGSELQSGATDIGGVIFLIVRGLLMNGILIAVIHITFKKKDIVRNEKS